MDQVDVVAVVGACVPERQRYATSFASGTKRMLIPASRIDGERDPVFSAASLATWSDQPAGAVIEFPSTVPTHEAIGMLTDEEHEVRLLGVVCVVDAAHLLDDLAVDDYLVAERDALGQPVEYVARASLTTTQIEYASMIVLVGWEALPTPELSTIMALLSSLAPKARLRLDTGDLDSFSHDETFSAGGAMSSDQDRIGWMSVLNEESDPHISDPRVSTFRYEQLRPFHPERLSEVLMHRFESGDFGQIVRSAGFCRFATRPRTVLQWDHVGHTISFHIVSELHPSGRCEHDAELVMVGQDLAFIGIDLDEAALRGALDEAALTDVELTAGPTAWAQFVDPFPASETAPTNE